MLRFKSAILAKLKNCQNGTFEPVHEIQKKILAKRLLFRRYESAKYKFAYNAYKFMKARKEPVKFQAKLVHLKIEQITCEYKPINKTTPLKLI